MAAALSGSPGERARLVRELVEKIIVDEKTIIIKLRRDVLLGEDGPSSASEAASDSAVELTAAAAFTRRGAETKLVLPGLVQQKHNSRCDPVLIKAIARGRAWFEELAIGRVRSLQELAKRDGISRRYIRRLIGLAFLSPQLVEAILQPSNWSLGPPTGSPKMVPPDCPFDIFSASSSGSAKRLLIVAGSTGWFEIPNAGWGILS